MVIFQNSSGITSYFLFSVQAAGMLAVGALMAGRIMDTV